MPSPISSPRGTVVSIWGKAYVRGVDGQWRLLKLGEVVRPADQLRTEQDSIVMMVDADGQVRPLQSAAATETDRVIAALNSADPQAATAAGLGGGDGGGFLPGLRVDRIAEDISPVTLATILDAAAVGFGRATRSNAPEDDILATVSASSSSIAALEEGGGVALGLTRPEGGGSLQVVVTQVPAIGQIVTAAGAPVAAGSSLAPDDLPGLRYVPPADYDGQTPIAPFTYSVSNGSSTATGSTQISLAAVNDAPVAVADSANTVSVNPITVAVLGNDRDVDGDPLTLSGASVNPALGSVAVNPNGSLTFTAAPGVSGPVTVSYTASDGRGGSASGTLSVNVAIAPSVSVDAPALSNDNTPRISGNSNLAPGASVSLSVTDANGAVQTFTATVQADGSYSVDVPAALADGPYSVVASVTVPGVGSASATDGGSIDSAAPALSVDAPTLSNDSTPTLSGSTDLPAGSTITLTVTDALGAVQNFTATVLPGGSFSADVPAALAQGNYSVVASANDAAGNPASASDSGAIDSIAPIASLSIDAIAGDNIVDPSEAAGPVVVTGSVGGDVQLNDSVTLVINGNSYSGNVQAGNRFAIAVSGADLFADPDRRIDGSVITADAAGNTTTAGATRDYQINRAPLANTDSLTATEDTAVIYTAAQLLGNDTDVDGNTLSIASVASGAGGTAVLNGDGTVTFTPNANFNGTADFTYVVTDGSLVSNTATVTVAVAAVNDAPIANADSLTATEDTAVIYTAAQLFGNDTDVDGNTLSIASVTSGAGGTAVLNGDGTVTFTPNANFNGTADFTYVITDGTLTSNTATVTVAVAAVNDAPVANTDSLTATEDTAVIYTAAQLLGNDTDVDGNTLSIASVTSGAGGTAVLNGDGTVTFTPNANFNGTADFTYVVTDGTLTSNTATVTVAVAAVNDAPDAVNDGSAATPFLTVLEDSGASAPITVLANDTDADGNPLTVTAATSANGSVTINGNGTLSFTPAANFNGPTSISYTVSDGNGGTDTATVFVNVTGTNDAPVALNVSASGFEDSVSRIVVTLAGSDVDGTIASYRITSLPANGSLFAAASGGTALALNAVVSGPVFFAPSANFNGNTSFGYTVTDNTGTVSTNTATANIAITAVNDAPTLGDVSAAITYTEGNTATVTRTLIDTTVSFTDIDSANLAGGTLRVAIGNVVANQDQLDIRSQGAGVSQISVVGTDVRYNFGSGAVSIGTLAGGTSGTALVVTFNANATPVAVDALIQNVRYGNTAQLPNTTPRTLSFTVTDGDGIANGGADTVVANVTVNVVSANDAPAFANLGGAVAYTENAVAIVLDSNATLNDPELGSGAIGSLNNLGGATLSLARSGGANAQDQFSGGGSLSLVGGNVVLGAAIVGSYSPAVLASGSLIITFAANTTVAQANSVLQQVRYANASDAPPASVAVAYVFSDGNTGAQGSGGARSASGTVTVNLSAVNDAPTVSAPASIGGTEDTPLPITGLTIADVDAGSAPVRVTLGVPSGAFNAVSAGGVTVSGGGTGSLVLDGTVANINAFIAAANAVYTPVANANGNVAMTVTVSDLGNSGSGGVRTASAGVTLAIAAVNDAPVANADSLTATEDTAVIYTAAQLLGNDTDVDGNTLSIASVTSGAGGTAMLNSDGTVTFTPNANFNGTADFRYAVTDGTLSSNTATVTVAVAAVNDAPVANADSLTATEDTAVIYTAAQLLDNDTDVDGNTLSIASVTSGAGGTAVLNGDGTVTFTPSANFNGSADFIYTVTDGTLTSNTATVTVAVAAANDAPVANTDSLTATEDTAVIYTATQLLGNDTDVDGNTLSIASVASGAGGTAVLNGDGTVTFTPNANFNGTADFTYVITDGSLVSNTATVTVAVAAINDAPVALAASAGTGENSVLNANVPAASDVDGTVASYALGSGLGAGNGALIFNADGSYRFDPGSDFDNLAAGATRQVSFTYTAIDNVGLASLPATVTITVTGTNDRPVLDLDANDSSGATGSGYRTAFIENGPAVRIGDLDTTLTDVDSATLVSATVTLTNAQTGDLLAPGALPAGITAVVAGNVVTLSGLAALTDYQSAIRAITFNNLGDFPSGIERVVTVVVNDGSDSSPAATTRISLQLINDAVTPTLSITPLGQWTFNEGSGSSTVNRWANPDQTGTLADDNASGGSALPTFLTTNQRNATSGSYVSFNDVGDRVNVAATATQPLMGTASLTFWIRTTQTGGNAGNGGSWDLPGVFASEQSGGGNDIQWGTINNAGRIGFAVGNTAGVYSTSAINNNQWNHVAITRNASTNFVEIWVNGVREATGSPTDAAFNGLLNRLTSMGVNNQFSGNAAGSDIADTRYFQGQLDDLRIYNRVLTADQIAAVRAIEGGFHDTAIANDGGALRFTLAQAGATTLTISGLAAGMALSDGTNTSTVAGPDDVVSLTGWNAAALEITNAGTNSATLVFTATNVVGSDTQSTVQYLNIVNGTSLLNGGAGADSLTGTAAADLLSGGAGNDVLGGGNGNDRLLGGTADDILNGNAGNDVLDGGDGADRLAGGAGSDRMSGGIGADVYEWRLADAGAAGAPPVDRISDFNVAASGAGGDVLDLRDLLQGETASATLDRYLDFDTTSLPGSTVIHVSSTGAFPIDAQWSAAQGSAEDQRIVLEGVDLRASLGFSAAVTDSQIIAELINRGKLITDVPPGS